MSDEPVKRGPGRPRKLPPEVSSAIYNPQRILAAMEPPFPSADDPGNYCGIAQPLLSTRFKEAAPIGVTNQAKDSAVTSKDGRMAVSVDWTRRVVIVLTKEQGVSCETLVPLENVKSMRPAPKKQEAVA